MEKPKNSKSSFRHRGYDCSQCSIGSMLFGNDAELNQCPSCGAQGTLKKAWDHIVTNTTLVEDVPAAT